MDFTGSAMTLTTGSTSIMDCGMYFGLESLNTLTD